MTSVSTYLDKSVAASTLQQYRRAWSDWEQYCREQHKTALPAAPPDVAAYLVREFESGRPVSTLERVNAGIAFYHRRAFHESPTGHETIKMLMRSFRRRPKPDRKCAPSMTEADLLQMARYAQTARDLRTWRTFWRCLVGFYGALRFSEVNQLQHEDVYLNAASVRLHVVRSKTDQYSEGRDRALSLNPYNPLLCPVSVTRRYLKLLGPAHMGSMQPKSGPTGIYYPDPINYDTSLGDLKWLCTAAQVVTQGLTEHSYRRGGTTKACGSGQRHEDIQRYVGWKDQKMVHKYIDLSLKTQLSFSRQMMRPEQ